MRSATLGAVVVTLLAACGGGSGEPGPPAPATGLAVTSTTLARVALAWTDASADEAGFAVERSASGGAFSEIGRVGADVTAFEDATVEPDRNYAYRVRSFGPRGVAAPSNVATTGTWTLGALEALLRQALLSMRGDEVAPGSFSGSTGGVTYTVDFTGFAFCAPPAPVAPPAAAATPPTTLYGCDNAGTATLVPSGDLLLVTIDLPQLYVDLATTSTLTGTDDGYALYSGVQLTLQAALATTPDGRRQLVEPIAATGFTYASREFHSQDGVVEGLASFMLGIAAGQIEAQLQDVAAQAVAANLTLIPPYVP